MAIDDVSPSLDSWKHNGRKANVTEATKVEKWVH